MVDDFCHSHSLTPKKPGPQASLCASEVITLAIFARWGRFSSERDFYRYARSCFIVHLIAVLEVQRRPPYEAFDSSAMPTLTVSA
jgi:hypothetical protein